MGGTENGRTYILAWESKITAGLVRGNGKQHEPACFFQLIGIGIQELSGQKKDADHLLVSIIQVPHLDGIKMFFHLFFKIISLWMFCAVKLFNTYSAFKLSFILLIEEANSSYV